MTMMGDGPPTRSFIWKFARRMLRRLTRYPRLISHEDYCKLRYQLPVEQRKKSRLGRALKHLNERHRIERQRHRTIIAERDDLKLLVPPTDLTAWKLAQRMKS